MKREDCAVCSSFGDLAETPHSEEAWRQIWLHNYSEHADLLKSEFSSRTEFISVGGKALSFRTDWDQIVSYAIKSLSKSLT